LILSFGQNTLESVVITFNGLHRIDDGLRPVLGIGKIDEMIELRGLLQEYRAFTGKVFLGQWSCYTAP